jgi:hypothetical protein
MQVGFERHAYINAVPGLLDGHGAPLTSFKLGQSNLHVLEVVRVPVPKSFGELSSR